MASSERPSDPAATHHEDQRPGRPPRPATEPAGGEGSTSPETETDPFTGEPNRSKAERG